MNSYELVTNEIKVFDLPELFQVKNFVSSLIKSKNSEYKLDNEPFPNCPHCHSKITKKNGKMKNGTQRYLCLNSKCGRSFSSNTNSFLKGSRKLNDYLYQMIEYTIDGLSIRNISGKLEIPIKTIWEWRTKIITLLEEFIDKENPFAKVLYSDETFLKINLKGTKKDKMPRKAYVRKTSAAGYRELVCIQTVIDQNKRSLLNINGVGRLSHSKLDSFLKPLILAGSTIVTDGERAYMEFAIERDLYHEPVMPGNNYSRNGYNLNLINNVHSTFKFFLKKYRGVSTRRLRGYINLYLIHQSLKQILELKEIPEYIFESLMDLKYNLSITEIYNADFPVNIYEIYEELRKDGFI
ncbi:MAG: IS1595 family transposase [Acholeplasmataceae bacterium]|jgi:transposase-like protein